LPRKFDEKIGLPRYGPVLDIIDSLTPIHFENDTVKKIHEIEDKIYIKYGKNRALSFTTKFLWIKVKQPIIIYDSKARIALGIKNGDLYAYYEKWREEFNVNQRAIIEACSKLPDMNKYAVNQEIGTKEYIREIADETWFHERVFDIYLWNKGNRV